MEDSLKNSHSISYPSFRPYLQPAGGKGLGFALKNSKTQPQDDKAVCITVDSAGPFAAILAAELSFDQNQPFMGVFLLMQPDDYQYSDSALKPVTNSDVDHLWQNALSEYHRDKALFPTVPAIQKDEQGRWVPFRSLFHCRHKAVYFDALCPACGQGLVLCRDDKVLEDAQLSCFTKSLERYLFCSSCHMEKPLFYIKRCQEQKSANVRNSADLIKDFGRLAQRTDLAETFPCATCDQAGQCYGSSNLAAERIVPISFYPFHLIVQHEPTVHALDFLALIGGADPNSVEKQLSDVHKTSRLKGIQDFQRLHPHDPGMLFAKDTRHFLELLYLKLTFLQMLISLVSAPSGQVKAFTHELSLDGLWVHLPGKSAYLPIFWSFDLEFIDVVGSPSPPALAGDLVRFQIRHFLGLAWFYVLLVNELQTFKDVTAGLEEALAAHNTQSDDSSDDDKKDGVPANGVFSNRHIFWHGGSFDPEPDWEALWQRSLDLGFSLLQSAMAADTAWSDETLNRDLAVLRTQIHQALFKADAGQPIVKTASPSDLKISAILESIIELWPQGDTASAGTSFQYQEAGAHEEEFQKTILLRPDVDGDVEETVILFDQAGTATGVRDEKSKSAPQEEKTVVVPPPPKKQDGASAGEQDDLAKTVIVAPSKPTKPKILPELDMAATVVTTGPSVGNRAADLDKTVIVTPGQKISAEQRSPKAVPPQGASTQPPGDDLEKTVIIGQQPASQQPASQQPASQQPAAPQPAPPKKKPAVKSISQRMWAQNARTYTPPPSKPKTDDDLPKTAIVDPSQSKDRKPK